MCHLKRPCKKSLHSVIPWLGFSDILHHNSPAAQDGAAQNYSQKQRLYFSSERSFVFAREEEMQREPRPVCMQGGSERVLSLILLGAGMVPGGSSLELLHSPERPSRGLPWHRNSRAVPTREGQSFWAQRGAHSSLDFNSSPLLLPLSCVSAPSLPKFPSSQPQAFHRGNISAETEGSEEQVATGMFADRRFSERGCFAGLPHLRVP